jgi:trehalose 6-phosphate phosphatase
MKKQGSHKVRHLLNCWSQVANCFQSSPTIALFLDFDGTLAPLQPRPEDVWLDDATRRTLSRLARSPRFRVWIVTGRRRADARARVRVPGIRYLGLHGWEGRSAAAITTEAREAISCAKCWLASLMLSVPGVWLEDKGLTLAVHYQSVADEGVRKARQFVEGVLAPFAEWLHLIRGKKVWELAPRELGDKGVAVASELSALGPGAVPVYIGDDRMDEPAFAALNGGITVHVGPACRTRARYRLSSVQQVHQFLERLGREFA